MTTHSILILASILAQPAPTLEERSLNVLGWTLDLPGSSRVFVAEGAPGDSVGWQRLIQQAGARNASILVVRGVSRIEAGVLDAARARNLRIALAGDPARSAAAVSGLGAEAGLWATPVEWAASGVSPLAALSIVRSRLIGGTVSAGAVSEEFLKEAYRLDLRPLHWAMTGNGVDSLRNTIEALISYHQSYASRTQGTRRLAGVSAEERAAIESALPTQAPAKPGKPRKLLVFDLNVGRFGHPSIPYANLAMQLMGRKTGAFETVVSSDPAMLEPARLAGFDAVFLNNTIGDIFATPQAREAFEKFIANGGGVMANHAATVTATSWPEFGEILGARGASHRMTDERVRIQVEDPSNPVVRVFDGAPFEYADEIFRFQPPYSREKVRVLLSVDPARTDMQQGRCYGNCLRDDNDYPVAWVKKYGKGRVFYTTLGHNPHVFMDRRLLGIFLAAAQYVLGDLPAEDTPTPRAFPALDSAISALSSYDFGKDRTPVRQFEREMAIVVSWPEAVHAAEKKLIRLLESDAPLGAKETVCRQLAYMGTEASRPALEAMLKRKETAEIARYALHGLGSRGSKAGTAPVRELHAYAMAGRRDQIPLVLSSMESPQAEVRIAAIRSLVELGAAEHVPLLLKRAAESEGTEQDETRLTLARIPSLEVDRELVASLARTAGKEKVEAIRALGERGFGEAATPLLDALNDRDTAVRRESARALRAIARPEHATTLLARMQGAPPADWRLYEGAITAALSRSAKPDASSVISAYEGSKDAAFRQALLSILAPVGSAVSIPLIRAALNDPDPQTQRAAVRALSEWPTPEPIDDLLKLAGTSKDPATQALSIRGFVRLVQYPSERGVAASVKLLDQALAAASRAEEKRLVLSALQRLPSPEALEVAKRAEADPDVSAEAKNAAAMIQRNLSRRQGL